MPKNMNQLIAACMTITDKDGKTIEILHHEEHVNKQTIITSSSETTFYNICVSAVVKKGRQVETVAFIISVVKKITDTGTGALMIETSRATVKLPSKSRKHPQTQYCWRR